MEICDYCAREREDGQAWDERQQMHEHCFRELKREYEQDERRDEPPCYET